MSMKITVPWQIRSRNWWNRQHFNEEPLSTPVRSVTMEKDDLDHLGAMHQTLSRREKTRGLLGRIFRGRG